MEGQPVAGALVVLHPLDATLGFRPRGVSDAQGVVKFWTLTLDDGAPAGRYAVTIELYSRNESETEGTGGASGEDLLAGKYANPAASPWHVEVKPDDAANKFPPFVIERGP
jgi:hypothetical protein